MPEAFTLTHSPKDKFWTDSTTCDICKQPVVGDLFDARTFTTQWATMCMACWKQNTLQKTGTGIGQHYKQRTDGKWLKVAG